MSENHFFAIMSRMKYINRWSLMNNTRTENISEHSLTVAMLAHALATIKNKKLGGNIDVEHAAAVALFHDCTEIITGDLPTPIKYSSKTLRNAYANIENEAANQLLSTLPDYMRDEYRKLIIPSENDKEIQKIVKAADKLSALIKCIEEEQMGNNEFCKAKEEIMKWLENCGMKEVEIFISDFLPSYSLSLDEQNIAL
ncbi:MAG: 5'-deoxynucleotidase [Acutalibacteraceae bacterium]